jgi:tetratricopeptide (TPR) repeat protein
MDKLERILIQVKFQKNTNWIQTRRILQKAIRDYPGEKRLHEALGKLYEEQKLYKQAIAAFQQALKHNPDDTSIHHHIGNCYLYLGENRLAIDSYDRISDAHAELLYNKAFAYARLNKPQVSIIILEKMLQNNPSSEGAYYLLCDMLYTQKRYDEIITQMNTTQARFGPTALVFYFRGVAYYHLQKYLNAYVELQRVETFSFRHAHYYLTFARVCRNIGKQDLAIELYHQTIKLSPKDPSPYFELAELYLKSNQLDEIYELLELAKKFLPHSLALSLLNNRALQKRN